MDPSDPARPTVSNATNLTRSLASGVLSPRDLGALAVAKAQPVLISVGRLLLI
jgi:hypothetical protein